MTIHLRSIAAAFFIGLCGLTATPTKAQQATPPPAIRLNAGNIALPATDATWTDKLDNMPLPAQVMLHFSKLPDAAERQALAANGITLLDYVPDNTFTAIVRQRTVQARLTAMPIQSVINVLPEWRADKYLWKQAASGSGEIKVLLSVYSGTNIEEVRGLIEGLGGRMERGDMENYGTYTVAIPAAKLRHVAGWYATRYVSAHLEVRALDRQSLPALRGNIAVAPTLWGGYGLNGDSVTIGVGDNTSGIYHIDNLDRIVNYNPAQVTNHGIHINGITGGASIVNPLAQCMTPRVKLLDFFFSTVLSATGQMLAQHNMTITNNSYTVIAGDCEYFGTYDLYSRFLDSMALQYPTVQHVFAAGNDGNMTCAPYPQGYGTMGGGYQPSKNTLVVGSTTHNLIQAADQSRGPVRDGRIRPDIVAVGANVFSTFRYNTYAWAGGTSMASPHVASGLGALTQHYKRLHNAQPRADLLKAVVMGTAMDLGYKGPDFSFGFGSMDIGRALKMLDEQRYDTGSVATGASQNIVITVPAGMAQAKVTLYWNDQPANPTAATQLVNDLDLTVKTPDGNTRLPMVPDATLAYLLDPAIERADHLNNAEQVTIDNPAAGTYTITVTGHNIPFDPQHFVAVYDLLPKQVQLTFPLGGEQLSNVDSLRVFWNAVNDGNTFKVEFSFDGANWSVIEDNIPAWKRYCGFMPTNFNSGNCRVRVSRNGTAEVMASQRFAISDTPNVRLAAAQCPGYVNINWKPVPGATAYELLRKVGTQMVIVDTVADTAYSFSGMPLTEVSYVAVQPIINGLSGYRSLAVSRLANDGSCTAASSTGDLMVEKVLSPTSGRLNTATAPGATSNLMVRVRNLYNVLCGSYTFSYRVYPGPWVAVPNAAGILPASAATVVDIPGLALSAPGTYTVAVAIHNNAVADPQPGNDTLVYSFKILPNEPVSLTTPFTDGFEDVPEITVRHDSIGISPNGHWDFSADDDSGRLRSYVYSEVAISGNRSMSLDQFMPMAQGSRNMLTGTFNLSGYDTGAHEVRVDFDYIFHGIPGRKPGNLVRARGVDAQPWRDLYYYDFSAYPGDVLKARSLSLTDAVRLGGYNFSPSTQITFCQNDTTLIAGRSYGVGMTFDNFRLYTVTNDAAIAAIVSPQANNCGLSATLPLKIRVVNGVNYTLHNVQVSYSLDSGTVHTETIDSIRAKDSLIFSFSQIMDISARSFHKVSVWLSSPGDSYSTNDSILNFEFRNSPIITNFPHIEDFEAGDGGFYTSGFQSSWQYGTPAATRIGKAASGTKAWKSNLTGRYNDLEQSYLYSPCYDIAQLTNPTLSFSMAQDLENCGNTLCDGAWLEYSFDGAEWAKLGAQGEGYNWYGGPFNIWNTQSFTRWHVATIALPKPPAGQVLHLRFALQADPAVTFEGLGIDDIHIYNGLHPICPANAKETTITLDPPTGLWTEYLASGGHVANIRPRKNLGNTAVSLYQHENIANTGQTQYLLPRSYAIRPQVAPVDSNDIQLFLEDIDFEKITKDTSCKSCTPVPDAYSLGITQYYNTSNRDAENGLLTDDTGGRFVFYPADVVKWVPFDRGYRASLTVRELSELWFNNGGPTGNFPAGTDYMNFTAFRINDNKPLIYWHSLIDTAIKSYDLQRSPDGYSFENIYNVQAKNATPGEYQYIDTAATAVNNDIYYRLEYSMKADDRVLHSPVRRVTLTDSAAGLVLLEANMINSNQALIRWTSYIDGMADNYILERAVGNGSFTTIEQRRAENRHGQQYAYIDNATDIGTATVIHYRLTVVLRDGSKVVLPERTLYWVNGSAVYAIYPNPTHDGAFTFQWNAETGSTMQLSLTDMTGRTVYATAVTATAWNNTSLIRTGRLPAGVYLLRFAEGSYRHTAKIVFE